MVHHGMDRRRVTRRSGRRHPALGSLHRRGPILDHREFGGFRRILAVLDGGDRTLGCHVFVVGALLSRSGTPRRGRTSRPSLVVWHRWRHHGVFERPLGVLPRPGNALDGGVCAGGNASPPVRVPRSGNEVLRARCVLFDIPSVRHCACVRGDGHHELVRDPAVSPGSISDRRWLVARWNRAWSLSWRLG